MEKLTVGRRIAAAFFPDRCVCCEKVIPPGEGVCPGCRAGLPRIGSPVCPLCGLEKEADCSAKVVFMFGYIFSNGEAKRSMSVVAAAV